MTMGQSFTVKVTKNSDGTHDAVCTTNPKIRATAKTASGAMAKVNDLLDRFVKNGA